MEKLVSGLVDIMKCLPDDEEVRDRFAALMQYAEEMGTEIVDLKKQVFLLNRKVSEYEEQLNKID